MNKDYGEILLESMSTLLEAYNRALVEPAEETKSEKEAREGAMLSTADPFLNFLPIATKKFDFTIQNEDGTVTDGRTLHGSTPPAPEEETTTPEGTDTEIEIAAEEDETGATTEGEEKEEEVTSTDPVPPTVNPAGRQFSTFWNYAGSKEKTNILAIEAVISTTRPDETAAATGDFGIMIGLTAKETTRVVYINRKSMFGNIYKLKRMPQRILVNLPEETDVSNIAVTCYNNATNLDFTVHNITLSLGVDLQELGPTMTPFEISCAEASPRFTATDRGEVVDNGAPNYLFEAKYIGKDAAGNYFVVTSDNLEYCPADFQVRWYKYVAGLVDGIDEFGGTYWAYLAGKDGWNYQCDNFDASHEFETYKAVLVGTNFETGEQVRLTSNEIAVEREVKPTAGFINRINLELTDGSNGAYPFYENDGYARTSLLPQVAKEREAKCHFETVELDDGGSLSAKFLSNLSSVEWIYESQSIKQIVNPEYGDGYECIDQDGLMYTINTFIDEEGYSHYQYTNIGQIQGIMVTDTFCVFKYNLAKSIMDNNLADKIICKFTFKNGQTFEATRAISLTKIGMNGTGYTIVSRLFNSANEQVGAIAMDRADKTYYVTVDVYDKNGEIVNGTKTFTNMEDNSTLGLSTPTEVNTTAQYWLPRLDKYPLVYNFDFYFTNDSTLIHLNDKILIPTCDSSVIDKVYQGVTKVIYTSEGNKPSYDASRITLLPEEDRTFKWNLVRNIDNNDLSLNPKIENGFFTPVGTWDKKMENKILYLMESNGLWIQPIIFLQDKHFSPIIDAWDGRFQINEEGNYIMSSAYVAGGKDDNNTFTGLVMGELATIKASEEEATNEEKTASETGLFGYKQGSQSFGFRTDGTAFLGEQGGGRINFDGNGGLIYSGNFDGLKLIEKKDNSGQVVKDEYGKIQYETVINAGTQGTCIDLQQGLLITANGQFRGRLKVDTGDLSGWQLNNNGLYRIRHYASADGKSDRDFVSGLNSESFVIKKEGDIGYEFKHETTASSYYTNIIGPKVTTKALPEWRIPRQIGGKTVRRFITTIDPGGQSLNTWSSRWSQSQLSKIYISQETHPLQFDNYFFYYASNLTEVYLPSTVTMGSLVFSDTATNTTIYLEGEPRATWPANWNGGAKVKANYSEWKAKCGECEDFYPDTSGGQTTEMTRFFAGAEQVNPTLTDWDAAVKTNKPLFLVSDHGMVRVTDMFAQRIYPANMEDNTITFGKVAEGTIGYSNYRHPQKAILNIIGVSDTSQGPSIYTTSLSADGIKATKPLAIYSKELNLQVGDTNTSPDDTKIKIQCTTTSGEKSLDLTYYTIPRLQGLISNYTNIETLINSQENLDYLIDSKEDLEELIKNKLWLTSLCDLYSTIRRLAGTDQGYGLYNELVGLATEPYYSKLVALAELTTEQIQYLVKNIPKTVD